jgi:hypothetical protein
LTIDKDLPSAGTAVSTHEEFMQKYPQYTPTIEPLFLQDGIYKHSDQNMIIKYTFDSEAFIFSVYKTDRLSSMNFDYDTNENIDKEEHKFPAKPFVSPAIGDTLLNLNYTMPLIVPGRNLNSYVLIDGKIQTEDKTDLPIILSIEQYNFAPRCGAISNSSVTLFPSNPSQIPANITSLRTWDAIGLFNQYWRTYDQILRSSWHIATYKFRLPVAMLHNFRFDRLKIIDGQPLLPVSVKYKLGSGAYVAAEIQFRTIRKYDRPADE